MNQDMTNKQSIDTPEFRAFLSSYNQGDITEAAFIAHIDAWRDAQVGQQGEAVEVHQWREKPRGSYQPAWWDASKNDAYARVDEHYEARTLYTQFAPTAASVSDELPPLPDPECRYEDGKDQWGYAEYGHAYSAEQMRDYARAALDHGTSSAPTDECARLRKVLIDVRHALQFANETPNGAISDTLWMMYSPETVFDFIDAALASPATTPASAQPANDLRADYLADQHYLLGLRAGWNLGMTEDYAAFDAILATRDEQLQAALAKTISISEEIEFQAALVDLMVDIKKFGAARTEKIEEFIAAVDSCVTARLAAPASPVAQAEANAGWQVTFDNLRVALDDLCSALPDVLPYSAFDRFRTTGKWSQGNSYALRGHTGTIIYRADDMECVYAVLDAAVRALQSATTAPVAPQGAQE